jgi:hypothetical protein
VAVAQDFDAVLQVHIFRSGKSGVAPAHHICPSQNCQPCQSVRHYFLAPDTVVEKEVETSEIDT